MRQVADSMPTSYFLLKILSHLCQRWISETHTKGLFGMLKHKVFVANRVEQRTEYLRSGGSSPDPTPYHTDASPLVRICNNNG